MLRKSILACAAFCCLILAGTSAAQTAQGSEQAAQSQDDQTIWKQKHQEKAKAVTRLGNDPNWKNKDSSGLEYKLKDNVSLKAEPKTQEQAGGLSANIKTSPDTTFSAGAGYSMDHASGQQGASRPGSEKEPDGASAGFKFKVSF